MTNDMILYAVLLLITASLSGIFVKMKSLGAKGTTLLYTPVIIPIVFIFNIKYALKVLKRGKYSKNAYKQFVNILLVSLKNLSLLTGILCRVMVDIQNEYEKVKVKAKIDAKQRCYRKFENNVTTTYKEILCYC